MNEREALKLALEALEGMYIPNFTMDDSPINNAITAIKEALAQPEQEPVAWMRHDGARVTTAADRKNYPDYETRYSVPLYTTPPQRTWVGLTDEEFEKMLNDVGFTRTDLLMIGSCVEQIVDLVEAKLKEKNNA